MDGRRFSLTGRPTKRSRAMQTRRSASVSVSRAPVSFSIAPDSIRSRPVSVSGQPVSLRSRAVDLNDGPATLTLAFHRFTAAPERQTGRLVSEILRPHARTGQILSRRFAFD
jgi:hypothetical protein